MRTEEAAKSFLPVQLQSPSLAAQVTDELQQAEVGLPLVPSPTKHL